MTRVAGERASPVPTTAASPDRVRRLVQAFIQSKCEEAHIRLALSDAAPLHRDATEADEAREDGSGISRTFIDEVLPSVQPTRRCVIAELLEETLTRVASSFSQTERTRQEIASNSGAMADMFNAYLAVLA